MIFLCDGADVGHARTVAQFKAVETAAAQFVCDVIPQEDEAMCEGGPLLFSVGWPWLHGRPFPCLMGHGFVSKRLRSW
jgi:hypothetical protein